MWEYKWRGGVCGVKVDGDSEGVGGVDAGRSVVDCWEGVEG